MLAQAKVAVAGATTECGDVGIRDGESISSEKEELVLDDIGRCPALDGGHLSLGFMLDAKILQRDPMLRPIEVTVHGEPNMMIAQVV